MLILVYCRGPFCLFAHRAAGLLVDEGRNVAVVSSGGVGLRAQRGAQS